MRKKRKTWQHLLAIPVILIFDIVALVLASISDSAVANTATLGHPAPGITIFAAILLCVVTVIVVIAAIVRTIAAIAANLRSAKK